jgi:CRP/FNR family transcriptional regulator
MNKPEQSNIFSSLKTCSRDLLLKDAVEISGRKGQVLISKGDEVSGVYLVSEGNLRVYAMNSEGKQATLYRLKGSEICLLSLNSTLTGGRYPAWVSVESDDVRVMALGGNAFRRLFSEESEVQNLILESLTSTVSDLLLKMDEALLSGLGERLESFLGNNRGADGNVRITHQELADHLGVTREAISRELSSLKKSGRIETGRNVVRVL